MHDRVALITGGGTGIGAAIARRLSADGVAVALVGRRKEPLESTVEQIRESGGTASLHTADLATVDAGELVQSVVDAHGRLDILVHNAATYAPAPARETVAASWDAHFAVNVTAPFRLSVAAHPHLEAARGVIVSILTNLALRPVANTAAYSASKAALASLTQTLALEWAPDGIRVVGVAAGVVDSGLHDDAVLEAMAGAHPLGRVGRPEEVADAVAFLCDEGSSWTTGAILPVDGGLGLA